KAGAGASEGTKQQEGEDGTGTSESFLAQHLNAETVMSWLARALSALTGVIADAFFIFVTVLFILGEASTFAGKLELAFGKGQKTLGPFEEFLNSVNRYLIIKTGTSILTGVVVWIFLAILGVKFAPLWGLISFLLNYIPTLGSILAAIPPVMLALVDIGLGGAVGVAAGQAVINVAIGNVLEPRLMGKELGLSALVIFISLAFWGSVLGIGGALLSVPLTVAVKIALNVREDTRWLAILMGSQAGARETVAVSGDSESGG
ncbi:MAG: AI-2E family transporter, partial [Planctomycetota bacterium]|nr:AI-2E family transporter [Planctomycetota bacterium]